MNILAVETSSRKLCVSGKNSKGKVFAYNVDSGLRHSELLLPLVKKGLKQSGLSMRDINYFAVGIGPGSFTGLRIGLATIKGFSAAFQKPVVGLPSLDILAYNALPADSGIICPLIDARRGLLFSALYEAKMNKLKRISPYLLIGINELLARIRPGVPVTFLGDGINLYEKNIEKRALKRIILNKDYWYPRAENLLKLSADLINKGRTEKAAKLKPIYLYPKECQIKIKNKR